MKALACSLAFCLLLLFEMAIILARFVDDWCHNSQLTNLKSLNFLPLEINLAAIRANKRFSLFASTYRNDEP